MQMAKLGFDFISFWRCQIIQFIISGSISFPRGQKYFDVTGFGPRRASAQADALTIALMLFDVVTNKVVFGGTICD